MSIEYNSLNLPDCFQTADGERGTFLYDYDGNKLYANGDDGDGDDNTYYEKHYCEDMEYLNWKLNRINLENEHGYVSMPDGEFHFYQKDHLGNVRLVVSQDGTIEQTNHYYPYGMSFAEGLQNANNPYKYNGKELDSFTKWYDYSARYMNPALGRFTTIDPMAEKYYSISPYAYAGNNPVNAIDTDWRKVVVANGSKDQFKRNFGIGTQSYLGMVSENYPTRKRKRILYM